MERGSTVLDVNGRSPRTGLYKALRGVVAWEGQYIGIGPHIPPKAAQAWNNAHLKNPNKHRARLRPMALEFSREQVLAGKALPFPPTSAHPFKMIAVAFCVDALEGIREKDNLVSDLKGVATQIVVAGGASESDLIRWEFQTLGGLEVNGKPTAWGVWMDERALRRWQRKNRIPETVMGMFDAKAGYKAVLPHRLGVCQKCGEPDPSGQSHFGCVKCGAENQVRNLKYRRSAV